MNLSRREALSGVCALTLGLSGCVETGESEHEHAEVTLSTDLEGAFCETTVRVNQWRDDRRAVVEHRGGEAVISAPADTYKTRHRVEKIRVVSYDHRGGPVSVRHFAEVQNDCTLKRFEQTESD